MKEQINWSTEMADAFPATKEALAKAPLLAHPSPGAEIALIAQATTWGRLFNRHLGGGGLAATGLLLQEVGLRPAAIFSLQPGIAGLFFWDTALPAHAGWAVICCIHRPQAPDLRPQ